MKLPVALICALLLCLFGNAASAAPYRVMMLLYRGETAAERGFKDHFKRRGIAVDYLVRDAAGDRQRIAGFVAEARQRKPDLVYAFGTTVSQLTVGQLGQIDPQQHLTDIPVVFAVVADPQGAGLLGEGTLSGRNLTGVSHLAPLVARLKAMQRYRPLRRLALVYNPAEANSSLGVAQLAQLLEQQSIAFDRVPLPLTAAGQPDLSLLEQAVWQAVQGKPDFLYLPSDSFLIANAQRVVAAASAYGVPVFSATEEPVRQGGALAGLVANYYAVGGLAGIKAEQILRQSLSPARIPVQTLDRFSYLLNAKTARRMQRYPPLGLLKEMEVVTVN